MAKRKKVARPKQPTPPADGTRLIGYARVSTEDQNLDMQLDALRKAGVMDDNLYFEARSGVSNKRPQLKMCWERGMDNCPKCRSHDINGPIYVRGHYGGESLKYTCTQCGYSKHENCADHQPHPAAQRLADPSKTWPRQPS